MNPSTKRNVTKQTTGDFAVASKSADEGMKGRDYFLPFHLVMDTPKNTTQIGYLSTIISLPVGRINDIWVEFPKGCAGLCGFQLWRGARQIFPVTQGIWQTGDNIFIKMRFTHVLTSEPLQIVGRSYNLDDTYKHKMNVIMEMSGNESDVPPGLNSFLDTLR
jgi:hypothetical protein